MNRNRLFTALNQLCIEMDIDYYINCGGCCYVAACLAEQFEKYKIPFKVVHYDMYHCHYAIKVSDRYINRAEYPAREIYEFPELDSNDLFDLYYNEDWNHRYNKKWNLIVRTKIESTFRKYANSRA